MSCCTKVILLGLGVTVLLAARVNAKCTDTFDFQANYQSYGATGYSEYRTADDCQQKCLAMADCIAFDFNRKKRPWKNMPCWIHQFPFGDLSPHEFTDHYLRVPCVAETDSPPVTIQPVTNLVPEVTQSPDIVETTYIAQYVTFGYQYNYRSRSDFDNSDIIFMETKEGITQGGKLIHWRFTVNQELEADYVLVLMLCRPIRDGFHCYSRTSVQDMPYGGTSLQYPDVEDYVQAGDLIAFYQQSSNEQALGLFFDEDKPYCGTSSHALKSDLLDEGYILSADVESLQPCRSYPIEVIIDAAARPPN